MVGNLANVNYRAIVYCRASDASLTSLKATSLLGSAKFGTCLVFLAELNFLVELLDLLAFGFGFSNRSLTF
jgi:hypothetical protein